MRMESLLEIHQEVIDPRMLESRCTLMVLPVKRKGATTLSVVTITATNLHHLAGTIATVLEGVTCFLLRLTLVMLLLTMTATETITADLPLLRLTPTLPLPLVTLQTTIVTALLHLVVVLLLPSITVLLYRIVEIALTTRSTSPLSPVLPLEEAAVVSQLQSILLT